MKYFSSKVSLRVPDVTFFVCSSSCNSLILGHVVSSFLSLSVALASHSAYEMPINIIKNNKNEAEKDIIT